MPFPSLSRRRFLLQGSAVLGSLGVGACDRVAASPRVQEVLANAEAVNRWIQRHLMGVKLARQYALADVSRQFKANGTTDPDDETYRHWRDTGFADWRLTLTGLVEQPASLSLAELRAMEARTQITRHDCVEGWSCIAQWTGVPLGTLLARAGLRPGARYVLFRCVDSLDGTPDRYYESLDLVDAFHPQTILAYAMNGDPLPVAHGAPLRLRVERQLGYKMAKYLTRIEVVEDLGRFGHGRGGYWEDRGYEWYAGI